MGLLFWARADASFLHRSAGPDAILNSDKKLEKPFIAAAGCSLPVRKPVRGFDDMKSAALRDGTFIFSVKSVAYWPKK